MYYVLEMHNGLLENIWIFQGETREQDAREYAKDLLEEQGVKDDINLNERDKFQHTDGDWSVHVGPTNLQPLIRSRYNK